MKFKHFSNRSLYQVRQWPGWPIPLNQYMRTGGTNVFKAELKKVKDEKEKCEQEMASMDNKIKHLQESLDKAEVANKTFF